MPIKPYDHTTYPANGAAGSSTALRSELDAIEAGFDLVALEIETAITGASGSATTATTKAAEALTSANNADISEAAAAVSAAAALVSQGAAATSETNAAASALAVANTYDAFDDRYLGTKSSAPTLDNDGNALQAGTLYWDSTLVTLRGYNGAAWINLPATTASNIVNVAAGNLSATDVQGALNELQGDVDALGSWKASATDLSNHIADTTDAHDASSISYLGNSGLAATNVEGALDELDNEKLSLAGGTLTGALNEAQGTDIASAGTVNLTTATGNYVHITGTTTITTVTLAQGYERTVVFDGALTLTNGASLLLPTSANITTAAGDAAIFRGEATGVVRCVAYVRKDGSALVSGTYLTAAEYKTGTDTTKILNAAIARGNNLVAGTAVASTSGTSIDFTGLPSWAKRITVMFSGVSTNGTSLGQVQLGAGSITTSGYFCTRNYVSSTTAGTSSITSGFYAFGGGATETGSGLIIISNLSGNTWVYSGTTAASTTVGNYMAGYITLGGTLDRLRITTVNGTDAFDAGSINIIWE